MLQYSQMSCRGWSRTIRSFRFGIGLAFPHSSLAEILARLSNLVCLEQVIRECQAHRRLNIRMEWIPADRAVFKVASVDQMRTRLLVFHCPSVRRSRTRSIACGNQTAPLPESLLNCQTLSCLWSAEIASANNSVVHLSLKVLGIARMGERRKIRAWKARSRSTNYKTLIKRLRTPLTTPARSGNGRSLTVRNKGQDRD